MSITEQILAHFLKQKDKTLSGEDLANIFHLSRTAVWMHIETLRKMGFVFDAVPRLGYRLVHIPEKLIAELIQDGLRTKILGRKIFVYESLDSTSTTAMHLAEEGMKDGTLVIAEEQKKGRGRLERVWFSAPEKSLTFSLVLRPNLPPTYMPLLTIVASLSLARCLQDMGFNATIKWPNDVLLEGKKVVGILTEARTEQDFMSYAVLGIGVNVNISEEEIPSEIKDQSTSLASVMGKKISRLRLLQDILYNLEKYYIQLKEMQIEAIIEEWSSFSALTGRWVEVIKKDGMEPLSGIMIGTDNYGAMLLRTPEGIIETVVCGDVQVLNKGEPQVGTSKDYYN